MSAATTLSVGIGAVALIAGVRRFFDTYHISNLSHLVSGALGGIVGQIGHSLLIRWRAAGSARRLCTAFWEELSAVVFGKLPASQGGGPLIGGFSSQTFDTMYADVVRSLPDSLARDLMRYHWRMKYLLDVQQANPVVLN